MKKVYRAKVVGTGKSCPKCQHQMLRRAHPYNWQPKPGQAFYYSYWDTCGRCRHTQHYEAAKVWLREGGELSRTIGVKYVLTPDDGSDPF